MPEADQEKRDADELAAAEKLAADKKAIKDAADAEKAAADAAYLANRQLIDDMLQQADLDAIDNMFVRAAEELRIQQELDIEKLRLAGATADEIDRINASYVDKSKKLAKEEADFNKAMKKQDVQNALSAGSDILSSISSLVGEGTAVGKAAAIASTTIDTYQSANAAYKSVVGIPVVGPVLAPIAAGVAVASGLMSIKKIVSTKTPGNKSAGGVPSITAPSAPSIDPTAALNAGANADTDANTEVTLGEQTGSQGPAVVRAYVVSSEVSSQQEADAKINDLARL